jgi:hypothetical protein
MAAMGCGDRVGDEKTLVKILNFTVTNMFYI